MSAQWSKAHARYWAINGSISASGSDLKIAGILWTHFVMEIRCGKARKIRHEENSLLGLFVVGKLVA